MEVKHLKYTVIIIGIIGFILFEYNGYRINQNNLELFVNKDVKGVIKNIKYTKHSRGTPVYKINDKWVYLGVNANNLNSYIQISDSISKDSGSMSITVFRKNLDGTWKEKVFH